MIEEKKHLQNKLILTIATLPPKRFIHFLFTWSVVIQTFIIYEKIILLLFYHFFFCVCNIISNILVYKIKTKTSLLRRFAMKFLKTDLNLEKYKVRPKDKKVKSYQNV